MKVMPAVRADHTDRHSKGKRPGFLMETQPQICFNETQLEAPTNQRNDEEGSADSATKFNQMSGAS